MITHCFSHILSQKSVLRFCVLVCLCASFPALSDAAKPGGGTTTTMVLTYTYGAPARWVARVDPLNVKAFQLTVMFDDSRVFPPTLIPKNPFTNAMLTPVPGGVQITASTPVTSPGDVDVFELVFVDRDPPPTPTPTPTPTRSL